MHSYLSLLLVLLICGGLLWIALATLMAWSILRPPRMSAGKAIYHLNRLSPGDLDLGFEELPFIVRDTRTGDKLTLASWWIPSAIPSDRCVIVIHGYADAKVGSIGFAPLFHDLDFNILAIDLRAHGDSDGRFCTAGYFERDDLMQIIDDLRAQFPHQTKQLILFGISLGAAVACATAARRADIAALILESPFANYRKAIAAHTRLMRLPTGRLLRTAIAIAEKISGAKFDKVRPVDQLRQVHCPVLLITGADDELLDDGDRRALQAANQTHLNSIFWSVSNATHLAPLVLNPTAYAQKVESFLSKLPNR